MKFIFKMVRIISCTYITLFSINLINFFFFKFFLKKVRIPLGFLVVFTTFCYALEEYNGIEGGEAEDPVVGGVFGFGGPFSPIKLNTIGGYGGLGGWKHGNSLTFGRIGGLKSYSGHYGSILGAPNPNAGEIDPQQHQVCAF